MVVPTEGGGVGAERQGGVKGPFLNKAATKLSNEFRFPIDSHTQKLTISGCVDLWQMRQGVSSTGTFSSSFSAQRMITRI